MESKNSGVPPPVVPGGFRSLPGAAEYAEAVLQLLSQARFNLALMSVELDQHLFGTPQFAERLRNFILQHRRARLRVLVHDPAKAVKNYLRLAELGRALSSRIEFRVVRPEDRLQSEEYLIADEISMLYRSAPTQAGAKHYADAPLVARTHLRAFEALWTESTIAREFSAVKI